MAAADSIWWEKTVEYAFVAQAAAEKLFSEAAALAGIPERHGADATFKADSRFVLIEFKKSRADFSSELKKFKEEPEAMYGQAARSMLASFSPCHFLVYMEVRSSRGDGAEQKIQTRQVVAVEYFLPESDVIRPSTNLLRLASDKPAATPISFSRSKPAVDRLVIDPLGDDLAIAEGILEQGRQRVGLSKKDFERYLVKFNQYRKEHSATLDGDGDGKGDGDGDGSGGGAGGGLRKVLAIGPDGQLLAALPVSMFKPTPQPQPSQTFKP